MAVLDRDDQALASVHWAFTGTVENAEWPEDVGTQAECDQGGDYCDSIAYALLRGEALQDGLVVEAIPLYVPFVSGYRQGYYSAGLFPTPTDRQRAQHAGVLMAIEGKDLPEEPDSSLVFGFVMAKELLARQEGTMAGLNQQVVSRKLLKEYAPEFLPEVATDLPGLDTDF